MIDMASSFTKPSLNYDEQLEHLSANGLEIRDKNLAEYWLKHVSYYRLSAYWLYYEHPKSKSGCRFRTGTSFTDITKLYDFDRDLRRLVMRGTEHVEVALRASWAYNLAHAGGPHAYLEPAHYRDSKEFNDGARRLRDSVARSSETYIAHYRQKYEHPPMPPVWMVAEMMSFGQLSRWYTNLRSRKLRNDIARPLGLPETILVPLVRHITDVRNICAHHGRLWNRGFLSPPKLAQKPRGLNDSLDLTATQAPAKLYNGLTTLGHIIRTVAPDSSWCSDLKQHIGTNPTGDFDAMGFPPNWSDRPMWIE